MKISGVALKLFFGAVALLVVSLTYNNCAISKFESISASQILGSPVVPPESGLGQAQYSCTGAFPSNANLCYQDDSGLKENVVRFISTNCSNRSKCEYICAAGYNYSNGACVPPTVFSCSTTLPCTHGTNCVQQTGSPTSVSQQWVLGSDNCGFTCINGYSGTNCQTPACSTGFTYVNGTCQPNTNNGFVCTGSVPEHSTFCVGDDQSLTADLSRVVANSCNDERKCQHVCDNGFNNVNGVCVSAINTCAAMQPCVNGTNCEITTGIPTSQNQAWVKGASVCGYRCYDGFTGTNCENGPIVASVACVNAEQELPLLSHWSNSSKAFSEMSNDQIELYNPNPSSNRMIYNYGMLPRHDNYIANNYEIKVVSDTEYRDAINRECQKAFTAIENRKPTSYTNWTVAKQAVKSNRGSMQVLHALVHGKNLVTVVLPPDWKSTDPAGTYPIMFDGVYDLGPALLAEDNLILQTIAKSYRLQNKKYIGVLWNGAGAVGSRSMQATARRDFNEIIQKVGTIFGGDVQKIFAFGGSRGGYVAVSMAANPENYPYKIPVLAAVVPPADLSLINELTGSTVPGLILAAEWSIGTLDSWKKDYKYPFNNEMKDFNRGEAHMYVLTGQKDKATLDATISLTSPYIINALKAKAPRFYLELGSHDAIVPWMDQFRFYNSLVQAGIGFESRINYMTGHWAAPAANEGLLQVDNFVEIMRKMTSGEINSIFVHGNRTQYLNDYKTSSLRRIDSNIRFTMEIPRLQSQNVVGHIIMTGIPRTKVKFSYNLNNVDTTIDVETDDKGVVYANLAGIGIGTYTITEVKIQKPGMTDWKVIDFKNSTSNWGRGILKIDVLDDSSVNADTGAGPIQQAIIESYLGPDSVHATNGFKNVSFGVVED